MGLQLSYSLADQEFVHTKSLGVWNVSTQLLGHLAQHPALEQLTVFTNRTQADLLPLSTKVRQVRHDSAVAGRWGRVCWDQWGVYSAARRAGHPWLFLPKGFASVYRACPVRLAAYVHDAMHDHYRQHHPHNPLVRESGYFLRSLRATLSNARVIFTNTDFTRREVLRLAEKWHLPPPDVVTAGIGFDLLKLRRNGNGERRRIVVLAGPWPHKCTARAVAWMQCWAAAQPVPVPVDWIGAMPTEVALPKLPGWEHHLRLAPGEYERVLGEAAALVYFSAYEGFGMPPVEGTLAGAAAVYSSIPAMTEVMQGCGHPFDNDSYEDFARRLDDALRTPAAQIAEWQNRLAARHSWTRIADDITNELLARAEVPATAKVFTPAKTLEAPTVSAPAKLVVFAHTPPPHHGQSFMVKMLLDGFGGDQRQSSTSPVTPHAVRCFHVNARVSNRLEDIGSFDPVKVLLLLRYCAEAVYCRLRFGARTLYYVPAPGKLSALLRDWLVMGLCRPFFPQLVLHWHAAGLADWLDSSSSPAARWLTQKLLGNASLSIVISGFNLRDAQTLGARRVAVVPNGIPDPCPDFARDLGPARLARLRQRQELLARKAAATETADFNVLYLAHATREKGLFDTLEAVRLAAIRLRAEGSPIRLRLTVAGDFLRDDERREFDKQIQHADLTGLVHYAGFLSGDAKSAALRAADLFCFPTFYANENQPVNLIEAMAWGLPVLTTEWRSVPALLPPGYPGIVPPQSPPALANALVRLTTYEGHNLLRERFETHYTIGVHLNNLAAALHSVNSGVP